MSKFIYEDTYTVTDRINDLFICTAWGEKGSITETLVHGSFLDAYGVQMNDSFECQVDSSGGILLETINRLEDLDLRALRF